MRQRASRPVDHRAVAAARKRLTSARRRVFCRARRVPADRAWPSARQEEWPQAAPKAGCVVARSHPTAGSPAAEVDHRQVRISPNDPSSPRHAAHHATPRGARGRPGGGRVRLDQTSASTNSSACAGVLGGSWQAGFAGPRRQRRRRRRRTGVRGGVPRTTSACRRSSGRHPTTSTPTPLLARPVERPAEVAGLVRAGMRIETRSPGSARPAASAARAARLAAPMPRHAAIARAASRRASIRTGSPLRRVEAPARTRPCPAPAVVDAADPVALQQGVEPGGARLSRRAWRSIVPVSSPSIRSSRSGGRSA